MILYKILPAADWRAAREFVPWSDDDRRDGFMHLSTAAQVLETARRRFSGRRGLVALEIDDAALGDALRYEESRRGALFPHYYGELGKSAVIGVRALVESDDGGFAFAAGDGGQ